MAVGYPDAHDAAARSFTGNIGLGVVIKLGVETAPAVVRAATPDQCSNPATP
jgi:hypothetical protein